VGTHAPFIFLTPTVVLCAILLGRSPAFAVLAIGAINGALLAPPVGSLRIANPADLATVIIFCAAGTVLTLVCSHLSAKTRRTAIAEKHLELALQNTGIGIFELDFAANTAHVQASKSVIQQQIDAGRLHYEAEQCVPLMELHGGTLTAHSDGPGRGSTFTVSLPASCICAETARAAGGEPGDGTADRATQRPSRRILIADDNIDAADSLAELLRLDGHEVHVAYDGEEALATFSRVQPEAALLDVGMPRLSGLEVVRAIRKIPSGQRATLITVTGWGQERDKHIALEAGFDHHMTKAIVPEAVQALLDMGRTRSLRHDS
jgi:CheY-like chemotaxis protein